MSDEVVVKPYRLERACQPQADMNQLVLKSLVATESVYSRTLVQLANASLPDVVIVDPLPPAEPTTPRLRRSSLRRSSTGTPT